MKISLRRFHTLIIAYDVFSHIINYIKFFFGDFKYQSASKLHYWFKSYGDFAEWLDFAYWLSCIGKGPRLQPAQHACFDNIRLG